MPRDTEIYGDAQFATAHPVKGPNELSISTHEYQLVVRLLAENWKMPQVVDEVARQFPASACSYGVVRRIKSTRQPEIKALREKINKQLDDLWIANKRQRVITLQRMFEDANRWTPVKAIETIENDEAGDPARRTSLVYKKDFGAMISVIKAVREELGEDAGARAATSLEDLVRLAEQSRGLETTHEKGDNLEGAVPVQEDAMLIDVPAQYRTRGSDDTRGFIDGAEVIDQEDEAGADVV